MGANATSYALVRTDGTVATFVRLDVPEGWSPPEGLLAVPDDELPEGWRLVPELGPVPRTVTARQLRLWLVRSGLSPAMVDQAIDAIPDQVDRETVRVEWEYAPYVERSHPWLEPLGSALGMTSAQIDDAFRQASRL